VRAGSRADRSGIQAGATILAVDRTSVHDIVQLQGLLLQTAGTTTRVEFDPGGMVELPRP
jgi:S1-C subfamily serine protease